MAKKKIVPSESPAVPASTPAPAAPARARKAPAQRVKAEISQRENSAAGEMATAADLSNPSAEPAVSAPSYEQIAEAAYHRFLQRGGDHGHEFDDWIEAERQLRGIV
jgi:hypothetical protein